MGKPFSEEEKNKIYELLIQNGEIFFSKYGLKRTNVEELTKVCGIAKGSFYSFYDSKEALFIDILKRNQIRTRDFIFKDFFNQLIVEEKDLKLLIKKIIYKSIELAENTPIMKSLFDEDENYIINRKMTKEDMAFFYKIDKENATIFIEQLSSNGFSVKYDPEILGGLLRTLFFIENSKSKIGLNIYKETLEFIIDAVCIKLELGK